MISQLACAKMTERRIVEVLRADNTKSIPPEQLSFEKGITEIIPAYNSMKRAGLTGIVKDDCKHHRHGLFQAIAADYQTSAHVFLEGKYLQSVELNCREMTPYGFGIGLGTVEEDIYLLVAYRDSLRLLAPKMDVFVYEDGAFSHLMCFKIGDLAEKNGGFSLPLFVGHDLENGIFLMVRSHTGEVWDPVPLVQVRDGKVIFKPAPLNYAARCSCADDYIRGKNLGLTELKESDFTTLDEE